MRLLALEATLFGICKKNRNKPRSLRKRDKNKRKENKSHAVYKPGLQKDNHINYLSEHKVKKQL